MMKISDYEILIKQERKNWFTKPYDLVYDSYLSLGYDKKDFGFFFNNASLIVETLRKSCWNNFIPEEKSFSSYMLNCLVTDEQLIDKSPREAIDWFSQEFAEHIYKLSLSNTQSRRSRAGKEFEAIIELLLVGAGIPFNSQGNVGKKVFVEKGLGKLVDVVSPGVVEFIINKRNTVLISAKTTLRERWQEVPEEMGRTGAREMFLATLDNNISDEVLETLYEANIQIVTTKAIRQERYLNNPRVLDFETFLLEANRSALLWEDYVYTNSQIEQYNQILDNQASKHKTHSNIKRFFENLKK